MATQSWLIRLVSACIPTFLVLSTISAAEFVEPAFPLQAGLRLTLGTALADVDIIDGFESDTVITVEAMWHHLYPITDNGDVRLIGSPSFAIVYQNGSNGPADVDYILSSLRFHLGVDVALASRVHLECAAFVGVGLGTLDISLANYQEDEIGLVTEWGITATGIVRTGRMEFGGGLGWLSRRGSNRFMVNDTDLVNIRIDQQYPKIFLAIGWVF